MRVETENGMLLIVLLPWLHRVLPESTGVGDVPDEQRLYQMIMSQYESDVRPVTTVTDTVIVHISLRLNQIIDLDERHQVLTTNVFIDQTWEDSSLAWDPSFYNNLSSIRIPSSRVWLPDTFVFNNADEGSTGFIQGKYVLVNYDGKVTWPVPVKLKSSCKVDISYFPFDDQKCALRVGSWVYSGRWVDFVPTDNETAVDLSSYVNNSEWDLLHVSRQKNTGLQAYSTEPHVRITYRLYMRRRTFYYIFNVIIPCMMLSVLTMLTFWLPPASSEKVTLGLSVFLAFSMFMLLIAQEVPPTSESLPLIGVYICVVMTMTSASVIMAVMVVNLYNRGVKCSRAPACLRTVMLGWLPAVFRLKRDVAFSEAALVREDDAHESVAGARHSIRLANTDLWRTTDRSSVDYQQHRNPSFDWTIEDEPVRKLRPTVAMECTTDNRRGSCYIPPAEYHRDHSAPSDFAPQYGARTADSVHGDQLKTKYIIAEWQRIAAVADRSLFWLFFTTLLVANITVLVVIPSTKSGNWTQNDAF